MPAARRRGGNRQFRTRPEVSGHESSLVPAVARTMLGREVDRSQTIRLRVSDSEKEGFELAAKNAGLTFSAWARMTLRHTALRELEEINVTAPFIEKPTDNGR